MPDPEVSAGSPPADTETVGRFNKWAETYEESWIQHAYFDRIHRSLLSEADNGPAPAIILDIGCGTGRLLRKAGERWPGSHLTGIDPAEGMINRARPLVPGAVFLVGSAESLPLPDSSFDLVLSTMSFHHWSGQLKGLREIRRVLRPGGRFLLADMEFPVFVSRLLHNGHVRHAREIRELFREAGLEVHLQRRIFLGHIVITVGSPRR